MNREEIIKLIWERMQEHVGNLGKVGPDISMNKAFECKQILNKICTTEELRKLQEGGKL